MLNSNKTTTIGVSQYFLRICRNRRNSTEIFSLLIENAQKDVLLLRSDCVKCPKFPAIPYSSRVNYGGIGLFRNTIAQSA